MAAAQFNLVTNWSLAAPLKRVWDELNHPDEWPQWWRAVKRVEMIAPGDASGVGATRRITWRTALPYEITFDMRATRIEPMSLLERRASGELDGVGRWTLTPTPAGTSVRYDWQVDLGKPWMQLLAPVLRPAFAWNHNKVMGWGYEGLCKRLGIMPG